MIRFICYSPPRVFVDPAAGGCATDKPASSRSSTMTRGVRMEDLTRAGDEEIPCGVFKANALFIRIGVPAFNG